MASIRWLGHSAFEVKMGGKTLLFDPWLDPRPRDSERNVPPATTAEKIKKADLIFITHEHYDHCDPYDVATIVQTTFAHVIAPGPALAKLDIPQRNKIIAIAGDSFSFQGIDVDVFSAVHPQSTEPVAFRVSAEGKSLFHAGDTYDHYALSNVQVDLAMVPIGGTYTMDTLASITALKKIRCKYAVPMHYGTFSRIDADVREWEQRVKKETKATPVVLEVGDSFEF
ncbi:MAG: MBL fold metallo-hydrolase [Candidatus Micrarchaeia archaeon]